MQSRCSMIISSCKLSNPAARVECQMLQYHPQCFAVLFFVTRPPEGDVVANPSLDFLYGTPDTPIFAISV